MLLLSCRRRPRPVTAGAGTVAGIPSGGGALVDALMDLVVADLDGSVALLGQGQERQGRRGLQAESTASARVATGRGIASASASVAAATDWASSPSSMRGGFVRRGDDVLGRGVVAATGRRGLSGRGWRATGVLGGRASVAVAVSLLKPSIRNDLIIGGRRKEKRSVHVLFCGPQLKCGLFYRSQGTDGHRRSETHVVDMTKECC